MWKVFKEELHEKLYDAFPGMFEFVAITMYVTAAISGVFAIVLVAMAIAAFTQVGVDGGVAVSLAVWAAMCFVSVPVLWFIGIISEAMRQVVLYKRSR